jgi:hypothetical protein
LRFPKGPILCNPCRRILHGLGGQPAAVHAAIDLALEQPRRFKHAKVLGYCGQRHGKGFGELRDFCFAAGQPREDCAARGIGQRAEGGVEPAAEIVNHTV